MNRVIVATSLLVVFVWANPAYAIWPLAPKDQPHPIRAGVIDPRGPSCFTATSDPISPPPCIFHKGVDIVTDDSYCNPKAPPKGCKRIFAVESGVVVKKWGGGGCGRVDVGRLVYSHVNSYRKVGKWINKGEPIGWSCLGSWHIHFAERPRGFKRQNWASEARVNPLRPGGSLADFHSRDTMPPQLRGVMVAPSGELWLRIEDPVPRYRLQSVSVSARLADVYNDLTPYRIVVDGKELMKIDRVPTIPFWSLFAIPTYRNFKVQPCATSETELDCAGQYWFRSGAYWAGVPVKVEAYDPAGNALITEVTG